MRYGRRGCGWGERASSALSDWQLCAHPGRFEPGLRRPKAIIRSGGRPTTGFDPLGAPPEPFSADQQRIDWPMRPSGWSRIIRLRPTLRARAVTVVVPMKLSCSPASAQRPQPFGAWKRPSAWKVMVTLQSPLSVQRPITSSRLAGVLMRNASATVAGSGGMAAVAGAHRVERPWVPSGCVRRMVFRSGELTRVVMVRAAMKLRTWFSNVHRPTPPLVVVNEPSAWKSIESEQSPVSVQRPIKNSLETAPPCAVEAVCAAAGEPGAGMQTPRASAMIRN